LNELFRHFAHRIAQASGSVAAFVLALVIVLVWLVTGPIFGFSDTWQLVINTGTTIVTFLMVFLIQNTQNRDSQAIHAKLDDLIVNLPGPDNRVVKAEDLSDEDLQLLEERFRQLADRTEAEAKNEKAAADELEDEATRKAASKSDVA
jgi:low affinity Fe/Cu permease